MQTLGGDDCKHCALRCGYPVGQPGYANRPTRSAPIVRGVRVRTDMGGPNAPFGVEDSTPGTADAITSQAGRTDIRFLDYRGRVIWW
jgi:hypothetical protein